MASCDHADAARCQNAVGGKSCTCLCHTQQQAIPPEMRALLLGLLREGQYAGVIACIKEYPQYAEQFAYLLSDYIDDAGGGREIELDAILSLLGGIFGNDPLMAFDGIFPADDRLN